MYGSQIGVKIWNSVAYFLILEPNVWWSGGAAHLPYGTSPPRQLSSKTTKQHRHTEVPPYHT